MKLNKAELSLFVTFFLRRSHSTATCGGDRKTLQKFLQKYHSNLKR
ncbi:hypothetical protein AVDCRST_MAG94-4101 [uncultured Leptolyngbya sp.]|uniref:Uncharacterized protein n=1 Tax=uncultured Leptolyngbya sp. TaxID=332963 RepID=A0A6J4MYL6_9CYAN|nr:hypothetical protein AVDCRST_MAG94-4101 [uncultured Leptolyngbya sp.]